MKLFSILFFAFLIASAPSCAQEKMSVREQKAVELMEVMGGDKMFDKVLVATMAQAFETQKRKLDKEDYVKFERYAEAARSATSDLAPDFTKRIAMVYAKHFTADEMDELIAFYSSPIGKKMTKKLPELSADSIEIGMELGEKIVERLESVDMSEMD